MTADRIDTLARDAAADLNRHVDTIDTEAALADLHRMAGGGRHRARRLVTGRRPLAIAAVVLVVTSLALAVGAFQGDDGQRVGTATSVPLDPPSYGPLLGTLHGLDNPALTAKVYGPRDLQDGSKVAVAITGGQPGRDYQVELCAAGDPDFNPAANCTYSSPDLTIGSNGSGAGVIETWAVFDSPTLFRNDCRVVACELQIAPIVQDTEGDAAPPGTVFAVQPEPENALSDSPWIPIAFAADASSPPLPAITATFLEDTEQGARVRIEGDDLPPGRAVVSVEGFPEPPTGMVTHTSGIGSAEVARVEVPADGSLSVEVTLPDAITESGVSTVNGVVQDPEIVACGVGTSLCRIRVAPLEWSAGPGRPPLTAQPVPYPEKR